MSQMSDYYSRIIGLWQLWPVTIFWPCTDVVLISDMYCIGRYLFPPFKAQPSIAERRVEWTHWNFTSTEIVTRQPPGGFHVWRPHRGGGKKVPQICGLTVQKLQTKGEGGQKIQKICGRHIWKPPTPAVSSRRTSACNVAGLSKPFELGWVNFL